MNSDEYIANFKVGDFLYTPYGQLTILLVLELTEYTYTMKVIKHEPNPKLINHIEIDSIDHLRKDLIVMTPLDKIKYL